MSKFTDFFTHRDIKERLSALEAEVREIKKTSGESEFKDMNSTSF
jgi:ABC-type sulfate transport system substrate-binding protein